MMIAIRTGARSLATDRHIIHRNAEYIGGDLCEGSLLALAMRTYSSVNRNHARRFDVTVADSQPPAGV